MSSTPKSLYPRKKAQAPVIPPMIVLIIIIVILFTLAVAMAIACTSPYNMAWA